MADEIPLRVLAHLLEDAGYHLSAVNGADHVFVRDGSPVRVTFPVSRGRVRRIYVQGAARILDEEGVLPRDEFDRRLHEPVNGSNGH